MRAHTKVQVMQFHPIQVLSHHVLRNGKIYNHMLERYFTKNSITFKLEIIKSADRYKLTLECIFNTHPV